LRARRIEKGRIPHGRGLLIFILPADLRDRQGLLDAAALADFSSRLAKHINDVIASPRVLQTAAAAALA